MSALRANREWLSRAACSAYVVGVRLLRTALKLLEHRHGPGFISYSRQNAGIR